MEQSFRTLFEWVQTVTIDYRVLKNLWPELVKGMVYLMNHMVTTAIKSSLTPLKALDCHRLGDKAKRPSIVHIPALGYKAFVHLQKGRRVQSQKLADRTESGILVGFEGNHIYRVYVPSRPGDKIVRTSTVVQSFSLPFLPLFA